MISQNLWRNTDFNWSLSHRVLVALMMPGVLGVLKAQGVPEGTSGTRGTGYQNWIPLLHGNKAHQSD